MVLKVWIRFVLDFPTSSKATARGYLLQKQQSGKITIKQFPGVT